MKPTDPKLTCAVYIAAPTDRVYSAPKSSGNRAAGWAVIRSSVKAHLEACRLLALSEQV